MWSVQHFVKARPSCKHYQYLHPLPISTSYTVLNQNQVWCVKIGRFLVFGFMVGTDYHVLLRYVLLLMAYVPHDCCV